jgi:hypothetical protein
MKTIELAELSEPIRSFLVRASQEKDLVIRDETGRTHYRVVSFSVPTPEERERAMKELARIQQRVGEAFREQGLTEDDLDRLLQEID